MSIFQGYITAAGILEGNVIFVPGNHDTMRPISLKGMIGYAIKSFYRFMMNCLGIGQERCIRVFEFY